MQGLRIAAATAALVKMFCKNGSHQPVDCGILVSVELGNSARLALGLGTALQLSSRKLRAWAGNSCVHVPED